MKKKMSERKKERSERMGISWAGKNRDAKESKV